MTQQHFCCVLICIFICFTLFILHFLEKAKYTFLILHNNISISINICHKKTQQQAKMINIYFFNGWTTKSYTVYKQDRDKMHLSLGVPLCYPLQSLGLPTVIKYEDCFTIAMNEIQNMLREKNNFQLVTLHGLNYLIRVIDRILKAWLNSTRRVL